MLQMARGNETHWVGFDSSLNAILLKKLERQGTILFSVLHCLSGISSGIIPFLCIG
jgi:hypothetical protein